MEKTEKYSIGVDLGGTTVKFGLVNQNGEIVKRIAKPTNAARGPDAVLNQIVKGLNEILNTEVKVKGIGIGAPGIVHPKKGTVENPPNLPGWKKVTMGKFLAKTFEMDVYVENDANAAAIGEMIYGAGKEHESFLMITLGTGVGGGIILKRKIYRGEIGAAGELGHVSIDHNGPKCNCGSFGCVEAYLGNHYLCARVAADLGHHPTSKLFELIDYDMQKLSPRVISEAADAGDAYAQSIIED
jgi:glucokinase